MRSTFPGSCPHISARCSVAASGRSAGRRSPAIRKISTAPTTRSRSCCPNDTHLHRWLDMAQERIKFQGLPARICWVGLGDRHRIGVAFNEMVASGELKAPIVIGRDHLDSGSVASPNRETEAMKDGSDAISDWPLLNALLNMRLGRDLGLDPPWRWRGHRVLAACRHGHRCRRHARSGATTGARAMERSGQWRDAPCGCRL